MPGPSKCREADIYRGAARLPAANGKHVLIRLLTDFHFARRAVRYVLGLPVPLETEDRRVLEQVIFRHFSQLPDTHRILFIGCDWYTKHYGRAFFRDRDYWTLDVSPKARKFGAKQHLVIGVEDVDRHFAENHFDVIYCNGVYGYGLDTAPQCERAFDRCWSRLREGGYFIFGWDDIPARTPVPLDAIAAIRRFRRLPLPELGTWRYLTDTPYRHTYDFYTKTV